MVSNTVLSNIFSKEIILYMIDNILLSIFWNSNEHVYPFNLAGKINHMIFRFGSTTLIENHSKMQASTFSTQLMSVVYLLSA